MVPKLIDLRTYVAGSFAPWYLAPHFVEEIEQHGNVDGAFLISRRFRQRKHDEALAVRRQVRVRTTAWEKDRRAGPEARPVRGKDIAFRCTEALHKGCA